MAMLLGAMKVILSGAVTPKHNIRFTFQRAEENPGTSEPTISGMIKMSVTYNSAKEESSWYRKGC
jgi:metal-dependent amidase/aminoacylase/carboxypeptidase family protein